MPVSIRDRCLSLHHRCHELPSEGTPKIIPPISNRIGQRRFFIRGLYRYSHRDLEYLHASKAVVRRSHKVARVSYHTMTCAGSLQDVLDTHLRLQPTELISTVRVTCEVIV